MKKEDLTQEKELDYTSRVPKYTFADTLEEQEAQLRASPLMRRLIESRKSVAGERYRPIYHYINPEHTLNDPNGLYFWKGRWHLFYQAYPPGDPRQHWGHAISDDLIHWRDLPYAIYPNPEEKCYSGATLVEEDRVIAMYHGTQVGNMVAVSRDPLLYEPGEGGEQGCHSDEKPRRVAHSLPGIRPVYLEERRHLLFAFGRYIAGWT